MRNFLRSALIWMTLIAMLGPVAGQAKPVAYQLNTSKSDVAFSYAFEGSEVKGTFPNFSADVALDFNRLEPCAAQKCWTQRLTRRLNSNLPN